MEKKQKAASSKVHQILLDGNEKALLNDKKKQGNKKDSLIEKYSDLSSSSDDSDYDEED